MVAYVIVDIEVTDPVSFEGYKKAIGANIAAFGGRYLTRGALQRYWKAIGLRGDWSFSSFQPWQG